MSESSALFVQLWMTLKIQSQGICICLLRFNDFLMTACAIIFCCPWSNNTEIWFWSSSVASSVMDKTFSLISASQVACSYVLSNWDQNDFCLRNSTIDGIDFELWYVMPWATSMVRCDCKCGARVIDKLVSDQLKKL